MRDCVSRSNLRRCAVMRATSSKRHPGWPETAISAMSQAHHIAPRRAEMLRRRELEDLRDDLERLHHARSGAVEILVAIGDVCAGTKAFEAGAFGEPMQFTLGAGEVEAAGRDDED